MAEEFVAEEAEIDGADTDVEPLDEAGDLTMMMIAEGMGEEEEQGDLFSRLGESSDDPEQQRMYREYLALIKEIECQNKIIAEIKANVMELCGKPCKSRNELREIKRLRVCMEQENIKLHTMMNRAIQLQNFGSPRHYRELALPTTVDEDQSPAYQCYTCPGGGASGSKSESLQEEDGSCESGGMGGGDEKTMQALGKLITKMKVCCPEDRKCIQEILIALLASKKSKSGTAAASVCDPCAEDDESTDEPPKAKARQQQQQRRGSRAAKQAPAPCGSSDSADKLKKRIMCMQANVKKLLQEVDKRGNGRDAAKGDGSVCSVSDESSFTKMLQACAPTCPPGGAGTQASPAAAAAMALRSGRAPCPAAEEPDPLVLCGGKNSKSDKYEKLKENYTRLLTEFQRKDTQMKELEKRMKGLCGSCGGGSGGGAGGLGSGKGGDADAAELNLLRVRVNELKEEQAEFKCIMKEQRQQLDDYRNKYLLAQQKVEEQCVALEKLNMNNKRIELQINTEVKEIRGKFQEKLNELLHFPKLLENEQLKLAQVCKEKDDLQSKLVVVCKELKTLKAQLDAPQAVDCRPQLAQCQLELTQAKAELEELLRQRDLFCEQLKATQDDLDTLRTESAKIIAGTKERAELLKNQQQEHVNRLEKELAQCRATATLSVSDREAVIREMQGQLNTLSYSFDAAQKQIKSLRNHIAYVSNENCFPVKC